jgi:hypothetical protein
VLWLLLLQAGEVFLCKEANEITSWSVTSHGQHVQLEGMAVENRAPHDLELGRTLPRADHSPRAGSSIILKGAASASSAIDVCGWGSETFCSI